MKFKEGEFSDDFTAVAVVVAVKLTSTKKNVPHSKVTSVS